MLTRKVEHVEVEEKMEEKEEETEEKPKNAKKVPLLSLTYCWPIIPYVEPNFTQSTFTSLASSRGSKRGFSDLASSLTCQLKKGGIKKINLDATARWSAVLEEENPEVGRMMRGAKRRRVEKRIWKNP